MKSVTLLGLASVLSLSQCRSTDRRRFDKLYSCSTVTLPVTTSDVPTLVLPFGEISDEYEAIAVLNAITARTQPEGTPTLVNITRDWEIEAQYCTPKGRRSSTTLQILTHGIGFNASYWDFYPSMNATDDQYSYVAAATAAGYSTLSYNRLGIKGSSLGNPYTEVQSNVELAILEKITSAARAGNIPGQRQAPRKVVHVGHSYGSILSNALIGIHPELSDGVILTGYSHLMTYSGYFAASTNFAIANMASATTFPEAQYANGYLTWPSKWANQYSFFAYGNFTPAILDDAEATKQPFTIGEFITLPLIDGNSTEFTKPVLYVNGEKDAIMCGGNCNGLIEPGTLAFTSFGTSTNVSSQIVPGYGHAMNQHLNAKSKMFAPINEWLQNNGF